MVTLQQVEIPGFREAVKRETQIRDAAFLDGRFLVCGVEVEPLSLRRLIWLEQAQNGFVCPWRWENYSEQFAHAVHFLFMLRPSYWPPKSPRVSFWQSFKSGWDEGLFTNRMRRKACVVEEVAEFLDAAFMDAPKGGGGEVLPPSYASYPVYLIDLFGEAGFPFTYEEIMTMPLARLWQFHRIASKRVNGTKLTNPSDEIATRHLAGGAA